MAPSMVSPMDLDVVTVSSSCSSSSSSTPCQLKARAIPTRRSTTVSFCNEVRVFRHLHLNDVTETERRTTWYNQDELNRVKVECNRTVRLVNRGALTQHDESSTLSSICTFRGLEFRTQSGANLRRVNKETAWDRVLDEQESQYMSGDFDDEKISSIYQETSRHCQEAAHLLGLSDEYAARQVYDIDQQQQCEDENDNCTKNKVDVVFKGQPHQQAHKILQRLASKDHSRPLTGLPDLTIRSKALCTVA